MSHTPEIDPHRPDPEFARHLEWQVRTALRRKSRFDDHGDHGDHGAVGAVGAVGAEPRAAWRWVRLAAIAALALILGAGSVLAAQRMQRSREAEILLESVHVRLHMASSRLDTAREERGALEGLVEQGLTSANELAEQELRVTRLELDLARLELDANEIEATGRDPSDRPSAPVVAGRDFVSERLALRAPLAQKEWLHAEERAQWTEQLRANGFASDSELSQRRRDVAAAEQELARVDRMLALRSDFVAGRTNAARAELEALWIAAETTLQGCLDAVEHAEAEADRVRLLDERGLASAAETRAAERALSETRAAAALAELELQLVDERKHQ